MQFLYIYKKNHFQFVTSQKQTKNSTSPPISYLSHMEKQGKERQRNFKIPAQIQSRIIQVQHNILLYHIEFSRFIFSQHV